MAKLLVVISGTTASGKTKLAITLAGHFNSEIVSADSRQIYKEMSIGTAIPPQEDMATIKHHFIQNKSVFDYYNAFMFETEVLQLLDVLFRRMNPVIMVGGSGLYINAVCYGIDDIPTVDPKVRKDMKTLYAREGIEGLRLLLKKLDPVYYRKADLRNPQRLLKALEISVMTGRPYSSFLSSTHKKRNFDILKIGIDMPREELYRHINERVDRMIKEGLVEEALRLYTYRNQNALNTVGYKEIFDYLNNKTSLEQAIDLIKRNTRRYARKQITWFRRDKDIHWYHPDQTEQIIEFIHNHMNGNNR